MQKGFGKLYLIPNFLADDNAENFIPEFVREQIHHLKSFIVETEKDARALIKKLKISTPQNELKILLWNEHSDKNTVHELLKIFENGNDVGIITDAGLPCVADPGNEVVAMAHKKNIDVIPLPGSSSIFMALMASGMNGQNFVFQTNKRNCATRCANGWTKAMTLTAAAPSRPRAVLTARSTPNWPSWA